MFIVFDMICTIVVFESENLSVICDLGHFEICLIILLYLNIFSFNPPRSLEPVGYPL